MGVILLNGRSSADIGLVVERPPDYEMAEKDYEIVPVPGRNGDIIIDKGGYKNVERSYDVAIGAEGANFALLAAKITNWLYSNVGYVRLEDSYEPDYFKMARLAQNEPIINILQQAGRATITFDRKPQRFLKSGEGSVILSSGMKMSNPTPFVALPLLKVTGTGTITFGGRTIKINKNTSFMYIDSETEDAYRDVATNLNPDVELPDGFPVLEPGNTTITFPATITKLEVTPRWWVI